jgi:hypothetical protein
MLSSAVYDAAETRNQLRVSVYVRRRRQYSTVSGTEDHHLALETAETINIQIVRAEAKRRAQRHERTVVEVVIGGGKSWSPSDLRSTTHRLSHRP